MDTDAQPTERDRVPTPRTGRERRSRSVRMAGAAVAAVLLALPAAEAFVAEPFRISSDSMGNTLEVGDRVLVNKLAYRFGNHPRRGDVVVFDGAGSFDRGTRDGTDYVKRIVGVGGDRVRCCDARGRIEVNGQPVDETYLHPDDRPSAVPFDIEVPEGRLWVMGDRRSRSRDSRDHLGSPGGGTVPVDRVIGRADRIVWPAGRWTSLRGRHG
ncbi:signal peptidase I [Streptomyces sp. TRM 70361]|uniref:signal peptidase I n=1 Tax=Streptomyces sp. TRM 70361 TaxID=3116553 RepID=UPI002E7ADEF0|nr:signal peptidase I [Streptomyces sp. TRM 70361]MEE1941848.1 signal peptidase I [Streptomyces sp. TRM 70361]